MVFRSNVQPKKRLELAEPWTCPHCKAKNDGVRYSCAECPEGRRPK